jgi:hypothetical protein
VCPGRNDTSEAADLHGAGIRKLSTFERIEMYVAKIGKLRGVSMSQWSEEEGVPDSEIVFQDDSNEWLYDLGDFDDVEEELN